MGIKENLAIIRNKIREACGKADRNPEDIKIVAATKSRTVEQVKQAMDGGINIIGENRVQEAERKFSQLPAIEKHLLGHLQTNKAKKAVKLFDCIQSIDSMKIAREVNKRAGQTGKLMPVFMEINIAGEQTKYGIRAEEADSFYDNLLNLENLKPQGVMSILPYIEPEQTRTYFKQLYQIYQNLELEYLSAGMSNDYLIAVEEGSNMLRLGTAIFGPRR